MAIATYSAFAVTLVVQREQLRIEELRITVNPGGNEGE